jgi:hypothetical protein
MNEFDNVYRMIYCAGWGQMWNQIWEIVDEDDGYWIKYREYMDLDAKIWHILWIELLIRTRTNYLHYE